MPIDIVETSFENKNNVAFNPAKLDLTCDEKIMTNAVVKMLKKVANISNLSIRLLMACYLKNLLI